MMLFFLKMHKNLPACLFCPQKTLCPFLWMELNCFNTAEPVWADSLLFTSKAKGVPGTHLIKLRRMKGCINLGATTWFWIQDLWIENPTLLKASINFWRDDWAVCGTGFRKYLNHIKEIYATVCTNTHNFFWNSLCRCTTTSEQYTRNEKRNSWKLLQ